MVKKKRQTDPHDAGSSTESCDEKSETSPGAGSSRDCVHVKKSVDTLKLRKQLKISGIETEQCSQCMKSGEGSPALETGSNNPAIDDGFEYDKTLWLCLKCGTQLCGRSKNQHALKHFKTPHSDSHALAMNTTTFEIWCYECDDEVNGASRKNLQECVEMVKRMASKPQTQSALPNNESEEIQLKNTPGKVLYETIRPHLSEEEIQNNDSPPVPPPLPPPIPGMAKRVQVETVRSPLKLKLQIRPQTEPPATGPLIPGFELEILPRVRGLSNLGNTCFFNAVLQCLAQTPFLLDVLKESSEPGEEFILPGGTFKFKDEKDVDLPPIKGTLNSWGGLTSALAQSLEELQSGGGVYTPGKLFDKLCIKCPQFRGGDQHDSHELLRHLLESVRSEDLKRYQKVILQNLGYKDQDTVSEDMRQKCKIYGQQAADRILRPEQVFRGFLVSTLTCQDCFNTSSRHEHFLDLSLPVSVEKPQPPIRRKTSPENASSSFTMLANGAASSTSLNNHQFKKEKDKRVVRKVRVTTQKKMKETQYISSDMGAIGGDSGDYTVITKAVRSSFKHSSSSSSAEQSDADVEDNLIDDNVMGFSSALNRVPPPLYDSNGNSELPSPVIPEKRGDSPENQDKDSIDEDENDSGIATSPAYGYLASSDSTTTATVVAMNGSGESSPNNKVVAVGLSEQGANLVRQLSLNSSTKISERNGCALEHCADDTLISDLEKIKIAPSAEQKVTKTASRPKRVRTQSHSDWNTTIAPRYQCEDGECSIQSCLNNFTAVELMTGNNKVGCDNCTKRVNGNDKKAKTIYTNATKQFLISSPPAVLILHLKRFQLGQRCIFRKLTRPVSFQMILDIAPFCGSKVKNLPNIDRRQKNLLYSLYGIVEHSGGMYGGHYTAYVKVRAKLDPSDKRWKFIPQGSKAELDQADEQREKLEELLAKEKAREIRMKAISDSDDFSTSCSSSEPEHESEPEGAVGGIDQPSVDVPMGKWYYVSDSRVQEVSEDTVLKAQAYLLFYERIY